MKYNWKLHSSMCVRKDNAVTAFGAVEVQLQEYLTREVDRTDFVYQTISLR